MPCTAQGASILLNMSFGPIVAGKNEQCIFNKLLPCAARVVGRLQIVEQPRDQHVVFIDVIEAEIVRGGTIHIPAGTLTGYAPILSVGV